ncbi:armadillo-type protein [Jimgerdemannia flammicorona]|uniref:Armadillo-type protein n=1 Tax=Jimgerdemannia flammicorona TaxID=994334 RepID=A0A433AV03_9FUNG|nr:armadillo-type protein [Jimgerdemannia flammicorona]
MKDPKVHWRFATMAANFLELLVRVDSPPTKDLADFAAHCTLSELPALRKIGVSSLTRMLLHIKQRTLARGDEDMLLVRGTVNPLKKIVTTPRPLPQDYTESLLKASWTEVKEENADNIDHLIWRTNNIHRICGRPSSYFVDNMAVGWYVWPEQYTAYAARTSTEPIAEIDAPSKAAYDQLRQSFVSREFWTKLSLYMSQESSKTNDDQFSTTNARLYKSIFQQFETSPLEPIKPEIEKLCLAFDQKNQQRAAAEILAGLIRGSKHWSIRHVNELWIWLSPLLLQTFAAITPDSLTYWESFVKFSCQDRDPRRVLPLVKLIFRVEFDPTSHAAFAEARKLLFIRAVLTSFTWRFLPESRKLLETYISNIRHPYKQVREVIGGNINELLQIQWIPSQPSVNELLRKNATGGDSVGNIPVEMNGYLKTILDELTRNLATWRAEKKPASSGSTEYGNASKTSTYEILTIFIVLLCWLHEALSTWRIAGTYPYILPLLPELFQMQDVNDDQDLQTMSTRVVTLIAQLSYPPEMVPLMVDKFVEMLTVSSSWHVRVKALPVLQVFFFKHLFLMEPKEVMRVMDVVSGMLLDNQIEVRQLAAVTLSGLIRCSQREAITSLKEHFLELLRTRIPPRKRATASERAIIPVGFQEAVLKRHAGALGLSCLIGAFPYEVPKWMPAVLIELAGLISDPVPIQVMWDYRFCSFSVHCQNTHSTVKKTFSDFRRTHSDTWHEDMLEFTEDQLLLLSDMLISPSYYA